MGVGVGGGGGIYENRMARMGGEREVNGRVVGGDIDGAVGVGVVHMGIGLVRWRGGLWYICNYRWGSGRGTYGIRAQFED